VAPAKFLFTAVQPGFEAALKQEVARRDASLKFAFSRPGFVTFRIGSDASAAGREQAAPSGGGGTASGGGRAASVDDPAASGERAGFRAAFARTWGYSLGKVAGPDARELASELWRIVAARCSADRIAEFRHVHAWRRGDVAGAELPGDEHFDAAGAAAARNAGELVVRERAAARDGAVLALNAQAAAGELVLDCVLVEAGEWWVGWHRAGSPETRWPGGVPPLKPHEAMISRAYLKLEEALLWSELPVRAGDRCVEIGSAPGGSCFALLERGCTVVGVDPAEMDPKVLAHPRFTHVRSRAKDTDRAVFRGSRWLTADINLPPTYTLDTVEAVVADPEARIEGLVLTLKLADPAIAAQLPLFNKRIRSWGYSFVRARQLAFDRQEVCVVARRS
jgi:23S rRNA (cytidine2498-2'-O)-methyltransferase